MQNVIVPFILKHPVFHSTEGQICMHEVVPVIKKALRHEGILEKWRYNSTDS